MTTAPAGTQYDLTPEQVDFRDTIRQMARERVAPRAAEIDAKGEYPWDLRKLFAEQDLLGLPFDERYGGTGTGALMLSVAIEEVARACASTALILMLQDLGTLPIKLFGTEELKQRFLPRCASGEWSPAFALSEPEAGSESANAGDHSPDAHLGRKRCLSSSEPKSLIGSVPRSCSIRISAVDAHARATSSMATLSISAPVPVPP